MVGYNSFFHVPAGSPILKHPLYLKYNVRTIGYIKQNMDTELISDIHSIMATNDNMGIIWYLRNLHGAISIS